MYIIVKLTVGKIYCDMNLVLYRIVFPEKVFVEILENIVVLEFCATCVLNSRNITTHAFTTEVFLFS